ncbi:hypothetical protein ACFX1Q_023646 [Malus domestica]
MKAAEKDEQYASFVYNACRDAIHHLLGMRVVVAYRNKTKLLRQGFYYVLTIGSGQQTLGEEYCDITQVAGVLDRSLSLAFAMVVGHGFWTTAAASISRRQSSESCRKGSGKQKQK